MAAGDENYREKGGVVGRKDGFRKADVKYKMDYFTHTHAPMKCVQNVTKFEGMDKNKTSNLLNINKLKNLFSGVTRT